MGRGSSQEAASILYGSDRTRQRVTVGGAVEYYDANGQLYKVRVPPASRENPEPYYQTPKQIESGDSFSAACTIHMRDGIPHRDPDQGPAVEYDGGDKLWMVDGESHREDGPATIWADGWEIWAQHGRHIARLRMAQR